MGRPKNRTLYKKKGAENWYYYQPGFGSVDTGTNDRFSAEQALKKTTIVNPVVDDVRSALAQLSAQMPKVENTIPIDDVPKPAPTPTPTSTEQPITTVPLLPRTPTAQDVLRKLSPDKRERLMSALSVQPSRRCS